MGAVRNGTDGLRFPPILPQPIPPVTRDPLAEAGHRYQDARLTTITEIGSGQTSQADSGKAIDYHFADANKDGSISQDEARQAASDSAAIGKNSGRFEDMDQNFDDLDTDGSGGLSREESYAAEDNSNASQEEEPVQASVLGADIDAASTAGQAQVLMDNQ